MAITNIAFGRPREIGDALKAAFAECISTLIFVFAGEGSGMALNKLTDNGPLTPAGLVVSSLAHGIGLFIGVAVSFNISGGHVNPAVTFGAFLGGYVSLMRGILYWIGQLIGSVIACLLLKFCTGGLYTSPLSLATDVSVWNAFVFEIVMTFGLVYTVYATALDPRKATLVTISPIAIGFIVGCNVLAGGPFDGAAMNPAVAFGPALATWSWTHQWVYWAGPLIGAAIAALIFDNIFIGYRTHEQIPTDDNF